MKKSLFAVAALTAIAGAAQAQSSVTVYGLLDVGYVGGNVRTADSIKANTAGYNNGTTRTTTNSLTSSAESTSRLGFKGVEDLGNGTSAFFTAEFALYPQDQLSSGNANGGLLNRQTFVGLKKNGIGQTAIGLQQTGIFNAVAVTDPGQMNNIAGNVIYAGNTGTTATSSATNSQAFTNRTANTITFQTDSFSGFRANALYSLNNKNSTETQVTGAGGSTFGGNTNASGWGLGADFAIQKFYINAQYQALKQLTVAQDTGTAIWTNQQANGSTSAPVSQGSAAGSNGASTTVTAGTAPVANTGLNIQDNQFYVGATYDFGILKAYAQYLNRKATSTITTNAYAKRTAEQIGVRSFITPTIEAWASAGLGRYTAYGVGSPTANFNAWQLGSNYYLSKRTNLYAIYGQALTSNAAAGTGTSATTASAGVSNYAIGVRHTF